MYCACVILEKKRLILCVVFLQIYTDKKNFKLLKTLNGGTCMKNLKHNPVKHMLPVAIYNFDLSYYKTLRRKFDGIPGFIFILSFSFVGHANV